MQMPVTLAAVVVIYLACLNSANADLLLAPGTKIVFSGGESAESGELASATTHDRQIPGHGGVNNTVSDNQAYVGGGNGNVASGNFSGVSHGLENEAAGDYSFILGGDENFISQDFGTIGGGAFNSVAVQPYGTVGGGAINNTSGSHATVGGGLSNQALAVGSAIGGGASNRVFGEYGTVPGGLGNLAGAYSMSIGRNATSEEDHVFVWNGSDSSIEVTVDSSFVLMPDAEAGVGIGTDAPETTLHVKKSVTGAAGPADHVAILENTSDSSHADVLLLQIGAPNPAGTGSANNFITFAESNNASLGALQSNGSSITLAGAGNDFAEWLPKTNPAEHIEPGDIVGLRNGAVSLSTAGVERAMIVSTAAIVAGNGPGEGNEDGYACVAFLGQADVKVAGSVRAGDFIIPSGRHDGAGIARPLSELTQAQYRAAVGYALEDSDGASLRRMRVLVADNEPDPSLSRLAEQLSAARAAITEIKGRNEALAARLSSIEPASTHSGDAP